jgi:hypothetical protein
MKHRFFHENSDLVLFTVHLYVYIEKTFSIMEKKKYALGFYIKSIISTMLVLILVVFFKQL